MAAQRATVHAMNAMALALIPPPAPFDPNDFDLWKSRILSTVSTYKWKIAFTEEPLAIPAAERPEAKSDEEKEYRADIRAKFFSYLLSCLDNATAAAFREHIAEADGQALFKAMCDRYESKTTTGKINALMALHNLKMEEGADVDQYISTFKKLCQNVIATGEKIDDAQKVVKFIASLPASYMNLTTALRIKENLTFDMAVREVKGQGEFIKATRPERLNYGNETGASSSSSSSNDRTQPGGGRGRGRGRGGGRGGNATRSRGGRGRLRHQNRTDDSSKCTRCGHDHPTRDCKFQGECNYCHKAGHMIKFCRTRIMAEERSGAATEHKQTHTMESMDEDANDGFPQVDSNYFTPDKIVTDTALTVSPDHSIVFVFDSGCTAHYVNDISILDDVKSVPALTVEMANKQTTQITQTGRLRIKSAIGTITFEEVRYAPGFGVNLLSVGRLDAKGARLTFGGNTGMLRNKHGQVELVATKQINNLYAVFVPRTDVLSGGDRHKPRNGKDEADETDDNESSKLTLKASEALVGKTLEQQPDLMRLLHRRLGHFNAASVQAMVDNNVVDGIDKVKLPPELGHCAGCKIGMLKRGAFKKIASRPPAPHVLYRIYFDLAGACNITFENEIQRSIWVALGEPRYGSLIMDDKARRLDGRALRTKDEAYEHVVNFIVYAENQTDRKVKIACFDGAGEFNSKRMLEFFKTRGIKVEITTRATSQHNPVERAIQTVFNGTRAALFEAELPPCFWSEAFLCTIVAINCRLHKRLPKNTTPEQEFSNLKPNIKNLLVWGSDAYVHAEEGQVGRRAIKAIYLGPDRDHPHGARFFDIDAMRVITRRLADAVVEEGSFKVGRKEIKSDHIKLRENILKCDLVPTRRPGNPIAPTPLAPPTIANTAAVPLLAARPARVRSRARSQSPAAARARSRSPAAAAAAAAGAAAPARDAAVGAARRAVRFLMGGQPVNGVTDYVGLILNSLREDCLATVDSGDPRTYEEAIESEDKQEWQKAMQREVEMLLSMPAWKLVERPSNANVLKGLWVLRTKFKKDGTIERRKARWAAKGFTQKHGVDFFDTASPVVKYKSLRIILYLAAKYNLEIKHMDFDSAFLQAPIKEKIYVEQPHGFVQGGDKIVCELLRALYGTKQASLAWNETLNHFLTNNMGFHRCESDVCVYVYKTKTDRVIIIAVFVDDIIIAHHRTDEAEWHAKKVILAAKFKIKDLGDADFVLGMRIERNRRENTLRLSQQLYLDKIVARFNMSDAKALDTPASGVRLTRAMGPQNEQEKQEAAKFPYMELVGSLLYAAISSRPDISHAVNEVCRHMANFGEQHWQAAKRVLQYIKSTNTLGITFKPFRSKAQSGDTITIDAYSDSDWAGDPDERKSVSGFVVKLDGCTVVWLCKKQSIVTLSSGEAEYVALNEAAKEVIWIKKFLAEITAAKLASTIFGDNQASAQMATSEQQSERTKHIDTRYKYINECVKNKHFKLQYIPTEHNLADLFTKPLQRVRFEALRKQILDE
jgi:hypothetical protein